MVNIEGLIERKNKVIKDMKDLYVTANKEDRDLSPEEDVTWNKMDADFKSIDARITKGEELRQRMDSIETAEVIVPDAGQDAADEARDLVSRRKTIEDQKKKDDAPKVSYRSAFESWANDPHRMSNEERSILNQGYRKEDRAITPQVSDVTTRGGFLSPEEWAKEIIASMAQFGGMLQAARIVPTKGGDTLHVPTEDVTSQVGAIIAQGVVDDVLDTTWGEKTMTAWTYTSRVIKVSQEFHAEDDAYSVLDRVKEIAASRVGRKINLDFTTGAGSTEPFGIVTSAADSGITGASQTAVTRTELLDVIHSVDPAYRGAKGVGFMFSDATLAAIRKLSIGSADDRPLWEPSMVSGEPSKIEGFPYYINQDMADMAASAKSIIFGDYKKYWIRQVRGMTLSRSDERYFEERVVAFFLTARFDGLLMDTAAVKYFTNLA